MQLQLRLAVAIIALSGFLPRLDWAAETDHLEKNICRRNFRSLEEKSRLERQKAVLRAYVDGWQQEPGKIYCDDRCHSNVTRLYEHMKSLIPSLEKNEFDVVYISFKGGPQFNEEDDRFSVRRGRPGYKDGKPIYRVQRKFHAVLKFGDFILDLDNTNRPKASTFRDYVKKFIDPEDLKYLYYYEVPGETYLSTPL